MWNTGTGRLYARFFSAESFSYRKFYTSNFTTDFFRTDSLYNRKLIDTIFLHRKFFAPNVFVRKANRTEDLIDFSTTRRQERKLT